MRILSCLLVLVLSTVILALEPVMISQKWLAKAHVEGVLLHGWDEVDSGEILDIEPDNGQPSIHNPTAFTRADTGLLELEHANSYASCAAKGYATAADKKVSVTGVQQAIVTLENDHFSGLQSNCSAYYDRIFKVPASSNAGPTQTVAVRMEIQCNAVQVPGIGWNHRNTLKVESGTSFLLATYDPVDNEWDISYLLYEENGDVLFVDETVEGPSLYKDYTTYRRVPNNTNFIISSSINRDEEEWQDAGLRQLLTNTDQTDYMVLYARATILSVTN